MPGSSDTATTTDPSVPPIRARGLTRAFGPVVAVDDVSFDVRAGAVTGFLGPNGAGKTTTLRMLLGLSRPTSGEATVLGGRFADLRHPSRHVGVCLESTGAHPGRSGRNHLRTLAPAAGVDARRVDEVLEQVDLAADARRRVGQYSLGMRRRLSLAAALLGRPRVLILDEPGNGLDPLGTAWLRGLLREYADAGNAVLFSSHVLGEVQQLVDDVVLLARGRVVHAGSIGSLLQDAGGEEHVRVASDDVAALTASLDRHGLDHRPAGADAVLVSGVDTARLGPMLIGDGVPVRAMSTGRSALEDRFLELVGGAQPTAPDPTVPDQMGRP